MRLRGVKYNSFFQGTMTRLHRAALFLINALLVWNGTEFDLFFTQGLRLASYVRFYYLLGVTGMIVVFFDMWFNVFWPEIRVAPLPNEDTEGWTPVHPSLYSVPEICRSLARAWSVAEEWFSWYVQLRFKSHTKFFLLTMLVLSSTALLGMYISGFIMIYLTVLMVLITPAVRYHHLDDCMWRVIAPYINTYLTYFTENILNIKRKKSKKAPKSRVRQRSQASMHADLTDSDASDHEFDSFVPPPADPKVSVTLSKAVAESDDSSAVTGLLTPMDLSRTPSRNISDTESHDEAFTAGFGSLPAFDDSRLEDSYNDEMPDAQLLAEATDLTDSTHNVTLTEGNIAINSFSLDIDAAVASLEDENKTPEASGMLFVSNHFEDSAESVSENEELQKGLSFTDAEADTSETDDTYAKRAIALVSNPTVTKTASLVMSSTMSGLTKLSQSVRSIAQGQGQQTDLKKGSNVTDSTASIAEGFEVINEDDL